MDREQLQDMKRTIERRERWYGWSKTMQGMKIPKEFRGAKYERKQAAEALMEGDFARKLGDYERALGAYTSALKLDETGKAQETGGLDTKKMALTRLERLLVQMTKDVQIQSVKEWSDLGRRTMQDSPKIYETAKRVIDTLEKYTT